MANEPTKSAPKPPEAPKPSEAPKTPEPQSIELEAAKAKLAALKAANELKAVQAEIDKLEAGGKGPAEMKVLRANELKREKTVKEGDLALYRLTEIGYKALRPGGEVSLQPAGTIIRIPLDRLPGLSMEAVKRAAPAAADEFAPA